MTSLLREKGRSFFVILLSEIFPDKVRGCLATPDRPCAAPLTTTLPRTCQLRLMQDVEAWVQIACPRLSIDWGAHFAAVRAVTPFLSTTALCMTPIPSCQPLLSPYELEVAMGATQWRSVYPMDYYSREGGPWTNYFEQEQARKAKRAEREAKRAQRRAARRRAAGGEQGGAAPADAPATAPCACRPGPGAE